MFPINGTILQYFHWYIDAELELWDLVKNNVQELANKGITALWLPPAFKSFNLQQPGRCWDDTGYNPYDLFDLGEFDQKDAVRTRYGTRPQYLEAIIAAQTAGLQVYADVVFHHKNGGDLPEIVEAVAVAWDNRNYDMSFLKHIKIYSQFNFPGRGDKYSKMKWRWQHFDTVNHNAYNWENDSVYRLKNKQFETPIDPRHGNESFLMACDIDTSNQEVQQELKNWGKWFLNLTGIDGFRLDAVKHIQPKFVKYWLDEMRYDSPKELFTVGDYRSSNIEALHQYIALTEGRLSLFDFPLHYNFHLASHIGQSYDMRKILDRTLMQQQPTLAVTFVENHESQPLRALESVVEPWFKPLAYAIILLREEGYPCIFYPDYYGAHYLDRGYEIGMASHRWLIDKFLYVRQHYAYGKQLNYFNHPDRIGWTRLGNDLHPQGVAVLLSNGPGGSEWMKVAQANTQFYDLTEHISEPVYTNEQGWGNFHCPGGSVSVWLPDLRLMKPTKD
ncbi:MAG: alpha-amylase [Microcoleaceae cyanobacterium]